MPRGDNKYRLKIERNVEAAELNVTVLEGETVVEEATFSYNDVADNAKPHVALYGLGQLLQDRASDTPTGPGKLAEMKEVFEMLKRGELERTRERGSPTVSAEVEALSRLKSITIPQAQAALKKYTKEQREKVLSHPKIVELAAQIRAERENATDISLDDLAA